MKLLRLLALLVGLFISLSVSAQREYSPNLAIGLKGGATLGRMSFSPEVHQKFVQGIEGGLRVRYTEEKIFGLIMELNLTQRGWAEDFARDDAPEFTYERHLTYLQIPLLTHIYFGSNKVRGFINLGPEFGFLIGDKIDANFDYHNYGSIAGFPQGYRTNRQLIMDVENKFDYGISGGAGIELLFRNRHSVMLEGRYYLGLGTYYTASNSAYFAASRTMAT
ncbi:MAG: PorT family protein, partial [Duncaniella sp.]|nr:PorT family protein [Duncaniella sp.]